MGGLIVPLMPGRPEPELRGNPLLNLAVTLFKGVGGREADDSVSIPQAGSLRDMNCGGHWPLSRGYGSWQGKGGCHGRVSGIGDTCSFLRGTSVGKY